MTGRYEVRDTVHPDWRGQRFTSLARAQRTVDESIPAGRFTIIDRYPDRPDTTTEHDDTTEHNDTTTTSERCYGWTAGVHQYNDRGWCTKCATPRPDTTATERSTL